MLNNEFVLYGLPALMILLGVLDVVTIDHALAEGRVELNPVIRFFMRHGVWPEAKLVLHFLAAGSVGWLLTGEYFKLGIAMGSVFCAIIGAAVASNVFKLVR